MTRKKAGAGGFFCLHGNSDEQHRQKNQFSK
jgi:hypothetical protein